VAGPRGHGRNQPFEVEIISLASFYISGYVYSPVIVIIRATFCGVKAVCRARYRGD